MVCHIKIKKHNIVTIYIPAVHIWQDECGAHAIPLTHAL